MAIRQSRKLALQVSILLSVLLLGGLAFSSCRGVGTVPKGWSGAAIADGSLLVGSMEGNLVGVNTSDGSRLWSVLLESPAAPRSGFGCAPGTSSVAIYGKPAVGEDLVYVGGYNGIVYAFQFDRDEPGFMRDEPRWVYPRQGTLGGPIVGGLVVAEGKAYFGSADGRVYALDAADGFKEWVFEAGDKIWSTPAVYDGRLFIGSFDNKLYALSTRDGSLKWAFETEGAIVSTPVVDNDTVYFGSFDRHLYAVDASDGSLRWKFRAENWFWAKPLVRNDVVYAACLDGKVYTIDAKAGTALVEFDLESPVSASPVLVGELVVVATEEGVVFVLDTESKQLWRLTDLEEKVYASLVADEAVVYIHTAKDSLYAVDAQSGAVRVFHIK